MSDITDLLTNEIRDFKKHLELRDAGKPIDTTPRREIVVRQTTLRQSSENIPSKPLKDDEDRQPPQPPQPEPSILPNFCPVGGSITLTIAGITNGFCGGGSGSDSYNVSAFSGLNGVQTLSWDASSSSFFLAGVGSVTDNHYPTSTTCGGTPDITATGSFELRATCSNGQWLILIQETLGPAISIGTVFSNATPGSKNTAISNDLSSASSFMGDGTVTVSY